MPVVMERPKMTRAMYDSLKQHILKRREKEKQEREELNQAIEEKNRQEEERKRQRRNEQQSMEQTREEMRLKEKELADCKDQKHNLFQQLKKILEKESELKKKQEKAEMMSRMHTMMMPHLQPLHQGALPGGAGAGGGVLPYLPHNKDHLTLLPTGMKRTHSPTPGPSPSTVSRQPLNPSLYNQPSYLDGGMAKATPYPYSKPTLTPAKVSATSSQGRPQPAYPAYQMQSFSQQQKRQSPQQQQQQQQQLQQQQQQQQQQLQQHQQQAAAHLYLQQQQQQQAAVSEAARHQQQRQLASSQHSKMSLGGGLMSTASHLAPQKGPGLGKDSRGAASRAGHPPPLPYSAHQSPFLPGSLGAATSTHRSYPQLAEDKFYGSVAAAAAAAAPAGHHSVMQHASTTSQLAGARGYPGLAGPPPPPRLLPPPQPQPGPHKHPSSQPRFY